MQICTTTSFISPEIYGPFFLLVLNHQLPSRQTHESMHMSTGVSRGPAAQYERINCALKLLAIPPGDSPVLPNQTRR